MRRSGQVAILRFPAADLSRGKARPVLLLAAVPGPYEDWLVCMFSTQLRQASPEFDEIVSEDDSDFESSGIKVTSVIRIARLAVVSADMFLGTTGEIGFERLQRIRQRLADWMQGS